MGDKPNENKGPTDFDETLPDYVSDSESSEAFPTFPDDLEIIPIVVSKQQAIWLPVANDSRSEDAAGVGAILDTVDPILDAVIIATQLAIA